MNPTAPMKVINLEQGSEPWLQHRFTVRNASDVGAMLGCDPLRSRSDLLDAIHLGWQEAPSAFKETIYAGGHRREAFARPLAEGVVGEDLMPIVGTRIWPGLPVALGASFDGLTMVRDTNWEHKQLSEELRQAMPKDLLDEDGFLPESEAHRLPKRHRGQMTQQAMVSGCTRVLFTASDWNDDGELIEARHCWYTPEPELAKEIVAGWLQFEADLATHTPVVHAAKPVANKPDTFPVPKLRVEGRVAETNIGEWRALAIAHIDSINTDLKTDQDFADAKAAVVWSEESEKTLKKLKEDAVAQMGSINDVFTAVDEIIAMMRNKRLSLDNKVKTRENEIRREIADAGAAKLRDHIAALNTRLGKPYMPRADGQAIAADFEKVIKGKRTVKSLHDAVESELTRCKIAASAIADNIDANLKYLRENAEDYKALFADAATIVLKAPDDLQALAKSRIADHKAEIERQAEAQRARIRAEEQERADREARERLAAEQAEAKRLADEQAARTQITSERGLQQVLKAEAATPDATDRSTPATASPGVGPMGAGQPADAGPAGNVVPLTRPAAPPADTGARVKLGDICASIAPLSITADGLAALGFKQEPSTGAAKLYKLTDLPAIYAAMVAHIEAVQAKQAA